VPNGAIYRLLVPIVGVQIGRKVFELLELGRGRRLARAREPAAVIKAMTRRLSGIQLVS